jgi:hypothetical protein
LPSARERPLLCGGQSNPLRFAQKGSSDIKSAKIKTAQKAVFILVERV